MIVKNEEHILSRILECAKQFADEIVIVDTGSTDKTKLVAERYTDKIYDFEWCDNFAKARNYSFSKATKDYIMWLDADDFIADEDIEKILALKPQLRADVYMSDYISKNNGKIVFSSTRERILRRCNLAIWQGFVHECICPFGQIVKAEFCIEHKPVYEKKDSHRNLLLYDKQLDKGVVFNAREQYYYAKEYYYNNKYKKCIKLLKHFLKMPGQFQPNTYDAYLTIVRCHKYLGNYEKALENGLLALTKISPTSELMCDIASVCVNLKDTQKAIFFYQSALNCKVPTGGEFVQTEYYHFIPNLELCALLYSTDKEKSYKHFCECKTSHADHLAVIYNQKFFL